MPLLVLGPASQDDDCLSYRMGLLTYIFFQLTMVRVNFLFVKFDQLISIKQPLSRVRPQILSSAEYSFLQTYSNR